MAGEVTKTTLSDGLKYYYLDTLREQINLKTSPFYGKIKKEPISGKQIVVPATYGVSGGVSTAAETSTFPVAGGTLIKNFTGDVKNLFGIIQLSDKVMKASRDSKGAFKSAMTMEMDRIVKTLARNVDRQLHGDGTGIITQINHSGGYSAATALVCDDVSNLEIGMIIDILNHSTHAVEADAVRITNIARSTKTITVASAVTVTDDADVCIQDSYNLELTGLGAILVASGTYYGLDRATYGWLVPDITNVNGVIDELDLQQAIDNADLNHGTNVDFIIASYGVRNSIMQLLKTYVQNLEVMKLEGGFTSIKYNGIDVIADRYVPIQTAYLLDSKTFTEFNYGDWDWLPGDNGSVLRSSATAAILQGVLIKYCDVFCHNPGGQTKLYGITENDGIA